MKTLYMSRFLVSEGISALGFNDGSDWVAGGRYGSRRCDCDFCLRLPCCLVCFLTYHFWRRAVLELCLLSGFLQ